MPESQAYEQVFRSHNPYAEAFLHQTHPGVFETQNPELLLKPEVQSWEHQLHKRLAREVKDADDRIRNAQQCSEMYRKEAHSLDRVLRHRVREIEDIKLEIAKPICEAENLRRRLTQTRKTAQEEDARKVTEEIEAAVAQARRETKQLYDKASQECQQLREEGIKERTRGHHVSAACDARVRSVASTIDASFRKVLALWGGPSDELAACGVPNEPVVRWFDALRRMLRKGLDEALKENLETHENKESEDVMLAREAAAGAVESWRVLKVRAGASNAEISNEKALRSEIHLCRERVESLESALAAQRRSNAALATAVDAEKSRRRAALQEQRSLVSLAAELLEDAEAQNLETHAALSRAKKRGLVAQRQMEQQKKKFQEVLRRNLKKSSTGLDHIAQGAGSGKSKRGKSR
eukprot:gnl/MRDRNA2_/MRDRNA2_105968_c0_seq1.p1 gnl/MRDRNA2_/MRDRNA2_105968_c0~~gnl/MRDRNA2_/MRDRNA2_105968_c0_seq1.p1  ORF type:complete len:409 (+),score=103.78 gnl/MRDRNA2_/MRDRNA2_105968_c0_seq1:82-1308(+)